LVTDIQFALGSVVISCKLVLVYSVDWRVAGWSKRRHRLSPERDVSAPGSTRRRCKQHPSPTKRWRWRHLNTVSDVRCKQRVSRRPLLCAVFEFRIHHSLCTRVHAVWFLLIFLVESPLSGSSFVISK